MLSEATKFLKKEADCIILCKHVGIKTDSIYIGDVRNVKEIDYEQQSVKLGYGDGNHDIKFFEDQDDNKAPQILKIYPPLPSNINYLHEMQESNAYINRIKSSVSGVIKNLSEEMVNEIISFLPIKFPIFISCGTILRKPGQFTHFSYPYSSRKDKIIDHLAKCEEFFESGNRAKHCYYSIEFYIMPNDITNQWKTVPDAVITSNQNSGIHVEFGYDKDTLSRKYNEPILIAKKEGNKLESMMHRNNVGGSLWMEIEWDIYEILKTVNDENKIEIRIGGGGGKKSRNYFQVNGADLKSDYIPMTIINVCCSMSSV